MRIILFRTYFVITYVFRFIELLLGLLYEIEVLLLCDDCELQHKECHCDSAREFIPKDKMEGTVKNSVLVFDNLEEFVI